MILLDRPLVVFDLETTGFCGTACRVIEIAYVVYEGRFAPEGRVEERTSLACPDQPVPARVTEITGLTDADVATAPPEGDVLREFARRVDGCDLAAYNGTGFDAPFLAKAFARHGLALRHRHLHDPLCVFQRDQPVRGKGRHTLTAAAAHYGVEAGTAHRALGDVHTTERVMLRQGERRLAALYGLFPQPTPFVAVWA